jgi:hypothetical protein
VDGHWGDELAWVGDGARDRVHGGRYVDERPWRVRRVGLRPWAEDKSRRSGENGDDFRPADN